MTLNFSFRKRISAIVTLFCLFGLWSFFVPSTTFAQVKPFHQVIKKSETVTVQPIIGSYQKIDAKKGDTLYSIAQKYEVSMNDLMRVNHRSSRRLKVGQHILLPTMRILPRNIGTGVVLNVAEKALYLLKDGQYLSCYPVALGKRTWQTALGNYEIRVKVKNPSWKPTKEMVAREGIKGDEVPPGPKNPLGDRWMGWSLKGFGFHSTTSPSSIGTAASHGCVRLTPATAHKMYDQVAVGWPILSIYEPILLGKQGDVYYISIFQDIYRTGFVSTKRAISLIMKAGIPGKVDEKLLAKFVGEQDGFPQRIPFLTAEEPPVKPVDSIPPTTTPRGLAPSTKIKEPSGTEKPPIPSKDKLVPPAKDKVVK